MYQKLACIFTGLCIAVTTELLFGQEFPPPTSRNPWGKSDVENPFAEKTKEKTKKFAEKPGLTAGDGDPNSADWATVEIGGDALKTLDGKWSLRVTWTGEEQPQEPEIAEIKTTEVKANSEPGKQAGKRIYMYCEFKNEYLKKNNKYFNPDKFAQFPTLYINEPLPILLGELQVDGQIGEKKRLIGGVRNLGITKGQVVGYDYVGVVIDTTRIDGRFTEGRLDLRRKKIEPAKDGSNLPLSAKRDSVKTESVTQASRPNSVQHDMAQRQAEKAALQHRLTQVEFLISTQEDRLKAYQEELPGAKADFKAALDQHAGVVAASIRLSEVQTSIIRIRGNLPSQKTERDKIKMQLAQFEKN